MKFYLTIAFIFVASFSFAQCTAFNDLNWQIPIEQNKTFEVEIIEEFDSGYAIISNTKEGYIQLSISDIRGCVYANQFISRGTSCKINSVIIDDNNIYMVGYVYRGLKSSKGKNGWIVKASLEGQVLWDKVLPGEKDIDLKFVQSQTNDTLLAIGNVRYSSKQAPLLIIKFQPDGQINIQREILKNTALTINTILPIGENNFFIAGAKERRGKNKASFLWLKNEEINWEYDFKEECEINNATITFDKKIVFTGYKYQNRLDRDVWAGKISLEEQRFFWEKTYGNDIGDDIGNDILELKNGKTLIVGKTFSHTLGSSTPKLWYHEIDYKGNSESKPKYFLWKKDHIARTIFYNKKGEIMLGGTENDEGFVANFNPSKITKPTITWVSPTLDSAKTEILKKGDDNFLSYVVEISSPFLLKKENILQKMNSVLLKGEMATKNFDFPSPSMKDEQFIYRITNKIPITMVDTTFELVLNAGAVTSTSMLNFRLIEPPILNIVWIQPAGANHNPPTRTIKKNALPVRFIIQTNQTLTDESFVLLVNGEPIDGAKFTETIIRPKRKKKKSKTSNLETYDYINNVFVKKGLNVIELEVDIKGQKTLSTPLKIKYVGNDVIVPVIEVDTTYDPTVTNLHVLAIGVSHVDLQFTTKDAQDMVTTFGQLEGKGIFKSVNIEYIIGEGATNVAINSKVENYKALYRLGDIQETDLFVLFISSHGFIYKDSVPSGDVWIPYEDFMIQGSNFDDAAMKATSVSYQDIIVNLSQIQCKKLVLIDACFSGGIKQKEVNEEAQSINDKIKEAGKRQPGLVTITSSTGEQPSYEDPEWQNGSFTEAILEAFEKGDYNRDGVVSLSELYKYINQRIPELVRTQKEQAQNPTITSFKMGTLPLFKK
jgi:hypothetical protein